MKKSLELKLADKILEDLKDEIMSILWDGESNLAFDEHYLLPFFQEEAEYKILGLNISEKQKNFYLEKVDRIMGEYSENIPYLGEREVDY